jgi:hypothetical protein
MKKKNNSKEVVNSLIPPNDSFVVEESGKGFGILQNIKYGFNIIHQRIKFLNNSKIFAGLIVIILNIAGKFVNIKLSKTMESYLKHTFSKQILVFAIAWMGTREIYVAFFISILFTICFEYLFHEDSMFFCLPEEFKDYHIELLENAEVSEEDIKKAKEVLEKAKAQNKEVGEEKPKTNANNSYYSSY